MITVPRHKKVRAYEAGFLKDFHALGDKRLRLHINRHAKALGVAPSTFRIVFNAAQHEINLALTLRGERPDSSEAFVPIGLTSVGGRAGVSNRDSVRDTMRGLVNLRLLEQNERGEYRISYELRQAAYVFPALIERLKVPDDTLGVTPRHRRYTGPNDTLGVTEGAKALVSAGDPTPKKYHGAFGGVHKKLRSIKKLSATDGTRHERHPPTDPTDAPDPDEGKAAISSLDELYGVRTVKGWRLTVEDDALGSFPVHDCRKCGGIVFIGIDTPATDRSAGFYVGEGVALHYGCSMNGR
jgi:hypothetical protein